MEIPETDSKASRTATPTRWVHRLYFLYLVLVPTLAVIGLLNLTGQPAANVHAVFAVPYLDWVLKGALFIGVLTYLALVTELSVPPPSALMTLFLIFDTPALVFLGSLAGGPPDLDLLAYDGLIEATAAVFALIPIQFTGSIRISPKSRRDIPYAKALIAVLGIGPAVVLGALLKGLAEDGAWLGIVTVLLATGWSTYSYYRLVRYAKTNGDNWGWILIGIFAGLIGGAIYGIVSANT